MQTGAPACKSGCHRLGVATLKIVCPKLGITSEWFGGRTCARPPATSCLCSITLTFAGLREAQDSCPPQASTSAKQVGVIDFILKLPSWKTSLNPYGSKLHGAKIRWKSAQPDTFSKMLETLDFQGFGRFFQFLKSYGFVPIFYTVNPHGYWARRHFLCGKFEIIV